MPWGHLTTSITEAPPTVYRINGVEVARMWQHVQTREWWATLDMHLPHEERRNRACHSFESGQAGVEAWASRHADRLASETAAIEMRRPRRAGIPAGQKDDPNTTRNLP